MDTKIREDLTAEEFIRDKIREKLELKGPMNGLSSYILNGQDALRWAHEFAQLKIKERDKKLVRISTYAKRIEKTQVWVAQLIIRDQLETVKIDNTLFIKTNDK